MNDKTNSSNLYYAEFERYDDVKDGWIAIAKDPSATILYANKAVAKLLGYTPGDLVGTSLDDHKMDRQPHSKNTDGKKDKDLKFGSMAKSKGIFGITKRGKPVRLSVDQMQLVPVGTEKVLFGRVKRANSFDKWVRKGIKSGKLRSNFTKGIAWFAAHPKFAAFFTTAIAPMVAAQINNPTLLKFWNELLDAIVNLTNP